MTEYSKVYSAFLARILEDEWGDWDVLSDAEEDWQELLDMAIARFKFPRVSLEKTAGGFVGDLKTPEIQILASFMKCEWLSRNLLTWENVKVQYDERDFSQANLIDKLTKLLDGERKEAKELESIYYRSIDGKPYKYSNLAGGS